MIQTSPARFIVHHDEQVTVTINAIGPFTSGTTGSYDNQTLAASSNNPDVYNFTIDGNSGDRHRFVYQCFFSNEAPESARYRITAQGDRDGGSFLVNLVSKQVDPPAIFDITFTIA